MFIFSRYNKISKLHRMHLVVFPCLFFAQVLRDLGKVLPWRERVQQPEKRARKKKTSRK